MLVEAPTPTPFRTPLLTPTLGFSLTSAPHTPEQVTQLEAGRPGAEQRERQQRRVRVLVEEHLQPRVAAPSARCCSLYTTWWDASAI